MEPKNRDTIARNRADLAKKYLAKKYSKSKLVQEESQSRRQNLEAELDKLDIPDVAREQYREQFQQAEADDLRDQRKRLTTEDFEPLALIGKSIGGVCVNIIHHHPFSLTLLILVFLQNTLLQIISMNTVDSYI